jgi:hypothetical protein
MTTSQVHVKVQVHVHMKSWQKVITTTKVRYINGVEPGSLRAAQTLTYLAHNNLDFLIIKICFEDSVTSEALQLFLSRMVKRGGAYRWSCVNLNGGLGWISP